VTSKRLSSAALVVYAFAVALGLGVPSAYWAVKAEYPVGSQRIGPWTTWPGVGSNQPDPYARAIMARRAEIPLALGEGLALTATMDSGGQALDTACAYRIGATTPQARLWTLTVYDATGRLRISDLVRAGITSAEVLREADGRFSVTLAPSARPGNWLKTPDGGRFSVVLRLYDTSVAASAANLDAKALPAIDRLDCGA
jgi:hypothetical protein